MPGATLSHTSGEHSNILINKYVCTHAWQHIQKQTI